MQTTNTRTRSESALVLTATAVTLLLASSARAQGCFSSRSGESETLAIELGMGKTALLEVELLTDASGEFHCSAWTTIPLSSFPSSRLAVRPSDVARSMRDVVKKLGARECAVMVEYENDTEEEFADHELCLIETFGFGRDGLWSKVTEDYCWHPKDDDIEVAVGVVEVD